MGSDTFTVRVAKVERDSVVLDLLPGTSGGYEDCYTSRSFALVILHDALHEAAFYARDAAEGARLDRKADRAPLTKALEKAGKGWRESPEWMAANVDRYVVSTEVVGRWNELGEQRLRRREMEIQKKMGGALTNDRAHEWRPMRWDRLFHYTLKVVVTDPKWIAPLEEGLELGTGAYEVWREAT